MIAKAKNTKASGFDDSAASGIGGLLAIGKMLPAVEFDHQSGVVFDNDYPTRRHIHTVVRTPNGNDYGKDLLRQHYARYPHPSVVGATAK